LSPSRINASRLFQRWFVRRSRKFIARHIDKKEHELIATSIVPWTPLVQTGELNTINIVNLQRRLKYALKDTKIPIALGGIDFSFNEDREGKYQPFWSVHFYLITSTESKTKLGNKLRGIYLKSEEVPRSVKISSFNNIAVRRSYALKMNFRRRIGYAEIKNRNGKIRKCRNTSSDKLRADERLELFIYLDQIGLASRVIFWRAKPIVNSSRVKIEKC
jgi:hypothetical protein